MLLPMNLLLKKPKMCKNDIFLWKKYFLSEKRCIFALQK